MDLEERCIMPGRRLFGRQLVGLVAGLVAGNAFETPAALHAETRRRNASQTHPRKHTHRDYAKVSVPRIGYQPILAMPNLRDVRLADNDTNVGRAERALRFRNITRAVEQRYAIPSDYLIGMICVESEGDPTQPNSGGDGGVGLIHMQPVNAERYGLHLITDSRKLRDFAQGRRINRAIDHYDADLKDLIALDERFHPIKNIDAAARMLCDHYEQTHSWDAALMRYAGRGSYAGKVKAYAKAMKSKRFMENLRADFSSCNHGTLLHGRQITFHSYQQVFYQQNLKNYGLEKYMTLPALHVR